VVKLPVINVLVRMREINYEKLVVVYSNFVDLYNMVIYLVVCG
jgi:hypothetical protein